MREFNCPMCGTPTHQLKSVWVTTSEGELKIPMCEKCEEKASVKQDEA